MNQPEHVDLVEAAHRLGVAWHVAYRMVLTGTLKGERRDGRWYVDATDLERLKREREHERPVQGRR